MSDLQKPAIHFHLQTAFSFRQRKKLKASIVYLFKREKVELIDLSLVFCSDTYLLKINRDFLNHDDLTDIITFDLSDEPDFMKGEIYISIHRVKENALKFKNNFVDELSRVIFHGCLHLCGYKDKHPADVKVMRAKEAYYMKHFLKP